MSLNPRKIYGFPEYPRTQDNQTVEQDIKRKAMEGINDETDPRLERVAKEAVKKDPSISMFEIEIEIGKPEKEAPKEEVKDAQQKLDDALQNNASSGYEYPDQYFMDHLIEGISSKDKKMHKLGVDCLKEAIGMLPENARRLIHGAWEKYFKENDMKGEQDG